MKTIALVSFALLISSAAFAQHHGGGMGHGGMGHGMGHGFGGPGFHRGLGIGPGYEDDSCYRYVITPYGRQLERVC